MSGTKPLGDVSHLSRHLAAADTVWSSNGSCGWVNMQVLSGVLMFAVSPDLPHACHFSREDKSLPCLISRETRTANGVTRPLCFDITSFILRSFFWTRQPLSHPGRMDGREVAAASSPQSEEDGSCYLLPHAADSGPDHPTPHLPSFSSHPSSSSRPFEATRCR